MWPITYNAAQTASCITKTEKNEKKNNLLNFHHFLFALIIKQHKKGNYSHN